MESHQTAVNERKDDRSHIGLAFVLNLIFTLVEIAGGIWANSIAIIADAIHDFGDSIALGSAWYFERLSTKRGNRRFSFGYRRFSLLGALVSATWLIIGGVIVLKAAIPRLLDPQSSNAPAMLTLAVIGILVNGVAALRLMKSPGMSGKMVMWHFWEDVLGWAAVLLVSIILLFWDIWILDPLLSILITLFVIWNVGKNLKQTMKVLLQGVPEDINLDQIENQLLLIDGVKAIHHTHLWSLDGERHVFSAHVVPSNNLVVSEDSRIRGSIQLILSDYGVMHSTLEIEYLSETCGIVDEQSCRRENGTEGEE